jgi:hypothetical protein
MASRKETAQTTTKAAAVQAASVGSRPPRPALQSAATRDPRQLMREAAWSRMFGRTEAKNPFTR